MPLLSMFLVTLPMGIALAAGGLLMLHPAHSAQAPPSLLDSLPETYCTYAEVAAEAPALRGYRDRPERSLPPPLAYLTVREGDGDKMRGIVGCDAISHGAAVSRYTSRGLEIHYSDAWKRRLSALNPWVDPETNALRNWRNLARNTPVPDYEVWARTATASVPTREAVAEPRTHRILLYVVEDNEGFWSDAETKKLGWYLVIFAAIFMGVVNGVAALWLWACSPSSR